MFVAISMTMLNKSESMTCDPLPDDWCCHGRLIGGSAHRRRRGRRAALQQLVEDQWFAVVGWHFAEKQKQEERLQVANTSSRVPSTAILVMGCYAKDSPASQS